MSYDVTCYRSKIGRPDAEEAEMLMELDEHGEHVLKPSADANDKIKITQALLDFNPRLENFDFDFDEIAKLQGISVDEAKRQFSHIELNPPEGDFAIQITVSDHDVWISFPYWYKGQELTEVFTRVHAYTTIINEVAGYYVYDPQTGRAFDPKVEDFDGQAIYAKMTQKVDELKAEQTQLVQKKPWWKFW